MNLFIKPAHYSIIICNFGAVKFIHALIVLLLLLTANGINAREADSLVLNRMFEYQHGYRNVVVDSFTTNCYTKYFYDTRRRNVALWLIPHMYPFAKGERQYVSEQFSQVKYEGIENIKVKPALFFTTVPHNREPLSVLNEFTIPQFYSTTLYGNHILSPFHPENRVYYRYRIKNSSSKQAVIEFRPLMGNNTQLVSGQATILRSTGRVTDVEIDGEYDMIRFHTSVRQGLELKKTQKSPLPASCKTDIDFKFLGNHITSSFVSMYNLPDLPKEKDSTMSDRERFDKTRPQRLSKREQSVLERYDSIHQAKTDTVRRDTVTTVFTVNTLKEIGWDVGSYLVRSHRASGEKFSYKLSPIIQPQYLNYSHSRGLSYKMKLSMEYRLGKNSDIDISPTLGYNFKIKQFYYQLPLRYTYNKEKNDYVELTWNNGNRIGNSSILEELKGELNELPEQDEYNLTVFDDYQIRLVNSTQVTQWLRLEGGVVYHRRTAVDKEYMRKYDKPEVYNSMAPSATLILTPLSHGPTFSVNVEHALKLKAFQMSYDRWEAGASQIFHLPRTQLLNIRLGGGFYASRHNNYFMSYANFSENYLAGGWDDDWSGEFQLLDSRLYNLSRYYLNANVSFDSPLMMTSFFPIIGHYIERERFYCNGVLVQYSRPYWELGYGFSTRFCSVGVFGSFLDFSYQEMGVKFTIELFHRW